MPKHRREYPIQDDKDHDPIELYKEAMDHQYDPGYWASTGRWIYQPFWKPLNLSPRTRAGAIVSALGIATVIGALAYPNHYWSMSGVGAVIALAGWLLFRSGSKAHQTR